MPAHYSGVTFAALRTTLPPRGMSPLHDQIWKIHKVLQRLLHMPQAESSVGNAKRSAKAQKSGESWGVCSTL